MEWYLGLLYGIHKRCDINKRWLHTIMEENKLRRINCPPNPLRISCLLKEESLIKLQGWNTSLGRGPAHGLWIRVPHEPVSSSSYADIWDECLLLWSLGNKSSQICGQGKDGLWDFGWFSSLYPLCSAPFRNPNPRRSVHYPLAADDLSPFSCAGALVSSIPAFWKFVGC